MKNKSITYLGITLVVLLIVFFISKSTDKTVGRTEYFVKVDTNLVDYIHLVSPDHGETTLEKVNDFWRVTDPVDFPAEVRNVHEVMKKLDGLEIENLVSGRAEQRSNYQVDSTGILVEVKGGGKMLANFYIGKPASTYKHTYMREVDSDDIFMVDGNFKYFFSRKTNDWRNKSIIQINKDAIEEFSVKFPDKSKQDRKASQEPFELWISSPYPGSKSTDPTNSPVT